MDPRFRTRMPPGPRGRSNNSLGIRPRVMAPWTHPSILVAFDKLPRWKPGRREESLRSQAHHLSKQVAPWQKAS